MGEAEPLDWFRLIGGVAGVVTIGDAILNHRKWFAETFSAIGIGGFKNAIGVGLVAYAAASIFQGANSIGQARNEVTVDGQDSEAKEGLEIDPEKLLAELPRDAKEVPAAVRRRHSLMLLTAREGGRTHAGLPIDLFEESKIAGMHPIYRCRICGREGRFESTSEGLSFREISIQEEDGRKSIKNPWPEKLPDYSPGF